MGDSTEKPLRVLYTGLRAPEEVSDGIDLRHRPMLEIEWTDVTPADLGELLTPQTTLLVYSRTAVDRLDREDWLARLSGLAERPWWSVGHKTAEALKRRLGIDARVPSEQNFEGLLAELSRRRPRAGTYRLVSLSLEGTTRDPGPALSEDGTWHDLPLYRTVPATYPSLDEELSDWSPDWILFTSPKGIDGFMANVDFSDVDARIAAIGPTTAEHLESYGLAADFVPDEPGRDALLRGLS